MRPGNSVVHPHSIVESNRSEYWPGADRGKSGHIVDAGTAAIVVLLGIAFWLIGAAMLFISGSMTGSSKAAAHPEMGQVVVGATVDPSDVGAVHWARDRFLEAGLSLPNVHLTFHDTTGICQGALGGFRAESDGSGRIFICVVESGYARELKVKRTLLHELAHAWDYHALTDPVRDEFMRLRGLEGWLSGVPYEQRAGELAAEVITWGLMDRPILMGSLKEPPSWEELYEGYLLLTDSEPPYGYVWSLFAAGRNIYAHTDSQLEIVQRIWDHLGENGRRTDKVEVRFYRNSDSCGGSATQSHLVGERLHVQACPAPREALTRGLLQELGGVPVSDSGQVVESVLSMDDR